MAQQGEHPPEHLLARQSGLAAVDAAPVRGAAAAELDRLVALPVEAREAIGLQPGQVGADGNGIGVALAVAAVYIVPAAEVGSGALGYIALGRWIADLAQLGRRAGIGGLTACQKVVKAGGAGLRAAPKPGASHASPIQAEAETGAGRRSSTCAVTAAEPATCSTASAVQA